MPEFTRPPPVLDNWRDHTQWDGPVCSECGHPLWASLRLWASDLDARLDRVESKLDTMAAVADDRWGQIAIGLEILRRMDAGG